MAALKYSRQREAIKSYLCGREDHPTADMIYTSIRGDFPNISLGTVYRNLNLLVETGEIQRLTCGDGADHPSSDPGARAEGSAAADPFPVWKTSYDHLRQQGGPFRSAHAEASAGYCGSSGRNGDPGDPHYRVDAHHQAGFSRAGLLRPEESGEERTYFQDVQIPFHVH